MTANLLSNISFKTTDQKTIDFRIRCAFAVAVLSVFAEKYLDLDDDLYSGHWIIVAGTFGLLFSIGSAVWEKTAQYAPVIFILSILPTAIGYWSTYANHGWLAIWLILPACFVKQWWKSEEYFQYIRISFGFVMLAACAQKLLAGTYLDGSYISYLSYYGSKTEQMFSFFCDKSKAIEAPCLGHQLIGIFIVVWQAIVGILLIIGVRHISVLFVEIAFLIGAGVYADELNFQALNIAFLCIAFGYGMSFPLILVGVIMIWLDIYSLGGILYLYFS